MILESLVYRAAIPLYYRRVRWFLRNIHRSPEVQRQRLFEKIRRHAASNFDQKHRLLFVRSLDDFRRNVPIANYEYYRGYVERLKKAQATALFAPGTEVLMFPMTSGTKQSCEVSACDARVLSGLPPQLAYLGHGQLCRSRRPGPKEVAAVDQQLATVLRGMRPAVRQYQRPGRRGHPLVCPACFRRSASGDSAR